MIIIRNSDGSVCCRTSDENNLCNRCRDKYREEFQEDMLVLPVMNFTDPNTILPAPDEVLDEILFARSCGRTEAEDELLKSDFVNNAGIHC
jgi:hypothetical protein